MTPDFSVIIPTRNREEYLQEAVASVLSQQDARLELLVVNDGDPLQISFTDPRVKVLDNRKRTGVPARNMGVDNATGRFIAFLDDDDWWIDPRHLFKAKASFDAHRDFYFADGVMMFPDGVQKPFARGATAASLEKDNTILISAVCYRRSIHGSLGRFDESIPYYWDWDWYLRVARGGYRFFHQHDPAVAIRVHEGNMSGQNEEPRRRDLAALEAKHALPPIPLKSHVDFV